MLNAPSCQYCATDDGKYPARPATHTTPAGKMCAECAYQYQQWKTAPAYLGPNDTLAD